MKLKELVTCYAISVGEARLELFGSLARAAWGGKAFVKLDRGDLVMYHDAFTYQVPTPYTFTFDDLAADDWAIVG